MDFLDVINGNSKAVRFYKPENIRSSSEMIESIIRLCTLPALSVDFIYMHDSVTQFGECSGSREFAPDVTEGVLQAWFENHHVDSICIVGSYTDSPVVIGYSFSEGLLYISLRKELLADISELDRELLLFGKVKIEKK